MFKRLRFALMGIFTAVLVTALVITPSSADIIGSPTLTIDNSEILCWEDGYLMARVTFTFEIEDIIILLRAASVDSGDSDYEANVVIYSDGTEILLGDSFFDIPGSGTYTFDVPLNNQPGGPSQNIPNPDGYTAGVAIFGDFFLFPFDAVTPASDAPWDSLIVLTTLSGLTYTPPVCDETTEPVTPPTDPITPPTDPTDPPTDPVPEVIVSLCAKQYPVLGSVLIGVGNPQVAEWGPGTGTIFISQNVPLILPNDANNDGADEYLIIDIAEDADGETWFGLFIGGCDPVYVRASAVPAVIR